MASYTIEDIELIRRKSGISYQEAVALLDYHNGNVARALIDLERNGRIRPESEQRAEEKKQAKEKEKGGLVGLIKKLYRMRVHIDKGDVVVANVSCLACLAAFLASPWTVIVAALLSAVLGYKISYVRNDPNFAADNLEKTVRNAAQNVKETADDIARGFRDATKNTEPEQNPYKPVDEKPAAAEEETDRSYYASNPAATTFHTGYTGGSAPTIQVPVKVESTDGDVSVDSERDGHNSATIG